MSINTSPKLYNDKTIILLPDKVKSLPVISKNVPRHILILKELKEIYKTDKIFLMKKLCGVSSFIYCMKNYYGKNWIFKIAKSDEFYEIFETEIQFHIIYKKLLNDISVPLEATFILKSGEPVLVFEKAYCDLYSLQLNNKELIIVIEMILHCISKLHENGIAHRDLKPENFVITKDNCDNITSVRLIDFAYAGPSINLKYIKKRCGTIGYMSPMVIRREGTTIQGDTWALGIMLYEMITKKNIFKNLKSFSKYEKELFLFNPSQFSEERLCSELPNDLKKCAKGFESILKYLFIYSDVCFSHGIISSFKFFYSI